jgi:hydroxymethylpyrimidine pyrophosphatase-like HAD family hydrolase
MMPVQALFFDLDSTLLDNSGISEAIRGTCGEIAAVRPGLVLHHTR